MSVTLTLEDEIDSSRGDMIVRPGNVPHLEDKFDAMVVWMTEEPLLPGQQYLFKHTTKMVPGTVSTLRYQVDVNTMKSNQTPALELNQIGRVSISLNKPIAYDGYKKNKNTGSFIIIDRITNVTVGAGMILDQLTSEDRADAWDSTPASSTLASQISNVTSEERQARFGQKPVTILFTGRPGAGKSTTAYGVERILFDRGRAATVIDGQNMRLGLNRDLGFSQADRSENLRRAAEVAKVINKSGLICIMSFVSPKEEVRQKAAEVIGKDNFFVVHLDAPREVCDTRNDSQKESDIEEARAGFEDPVNPDLVLDTVNETADACIGNVIKFLEEQGLLS